MTVSRAPFGRGERKRLAIAAVDTRREELDEASKPKLITFMDQDNLILEPDEHGNYVPTGDAFKRVKATEIEGINDRVPERIRRLREKPESFVVEYLNVLRLFVFVKLCRTGFQPASV